MATTQINYTLYASGLSIAPTETHISTDWEVATDIGFTNIVDSRYGDIVNLTEYSGTLTYTNTTPPSELYGRYRIQTDLSTYPYSDPVTIYNVNLGLTLQYYHITNGLRFDIQTTLPPGETHVSTDWYLFNTGNGAELFKSLNDTTNLTSISTPNYASTSPLRLHVSYTTSNLKSSMKCLVFDTSTSNTFVSAANYPINTFLCSGSTLGNGNVLVVGGWDGIDSIDSVYLYDPATDTWTPGANYPVRVRNHTQSTLSDGRVLVVGGKNNAIGVFGSCYLYDPTTNTWTPAANYPITVNIHSQSTLLDGRVLVVGGSDGTITRNECYIYDPTTDTWTQVANYPTSIGSHAQSTLSDGRVLVTGGYDGTNYLNTCNIYDPATDTWSPAANYPIAVYYAKQTTLMDGYVIAIGGVISGTWTSTNQCYRYDPTTDTWTSIANYPITISRHVVTTLNNGQILSTTGHNGSNSYNGTYIYTP